MLYEVNVNYEETYTVRVEANSPQEAQEIVELQIETDSIEAHPDRNTEHREWYVDTRLR